MVTYQNCVGNSPEDTEDGTPEDKVVSDINPEVSLRFLVWHMNS